MVHLKKKIEHKVEWKAEGFVNFYKTGRGKTCFLRGGASINFSNFISGDKFTSCDKTASYGGASSFVSLWHPLPHSRKISTFKETLRKLRRGSVLPGKEKFPWDQEQMLTMRAHMLKLPLWYRVRCHFGKPRDFCVQKKRGAIGMAVLHWGFLRYIIVISGFSTPLTSSFHFVSWSVQNDQEPHFAGVCDRHCLARRTNMHTMPPVYSIVGKPSNSVPLNTCTCIYIIVFVHAAGEFGNLFPNQNLYFFYN